MRRWTAAVLATAAVAALAELAVSATLDGGVRAEVAVAGNGRALGVRWIRILDRLTPGESYRLPPFGIRNHRAGRTTYRIVVSTRGAQAKRRAPRRWLRFAPAAVAIDAGRSRAVSVRLQLPDDAEPGAYAVGLGIRPGGSEGAHLTFRIEHAETMRAWLHKAANVAMWVVPTFVGAILALFLARVVMNRGAANGQQTSEIGFGQPCGIETRGAEKPHQ